tara:strand:- start:1335 stop:1709 length:375 start_codon:yes stop_codon:yes gene_type:complete
LHKIHIDKKYNIAALMIVICMIILGIAWEIWLNPIKEEGSLLWLKVTPLIVTLPGLVKGNVYTFQWISLLVWFYICEALVRVYTVQMIEIILSIIWLIMSIILFVIVWMAIKSFKKLKSSSNSG